MFVVHRLFIRYFCTSTIKTVSVVSLLLVMFFSQRAFGAESFQIDGFYLGASPEQLGVTVETDPWMSEKYYEVEVEEVRLFFIQVEEGLRVYRIIKENPIPDGGLKSTLDSLKIKYGTPDKQQVKTNSIKSYKGGISTSVKNRAVWNISESQEFIAEIESSRVIYELVDNEPEKIEAASAPGSGGSDGFTIESWDPDY